MRRSPLEFEETILIELDYAPDLDLIQMKQQVYVFILFSSVIVQLQEQNCNSGKNNQFRLFKHGMAGRNGGESIYSLFIFQIADEATASLEEFC